MKKILLGCIAILLYTQNTAAGGFGKKGIYKSSVTLESVLDASGVSLILNDDQIGVYHHFILEKSLDGKAYFEVARVEEVKEKEGSRKITFKDFPFEKTSLSCVFYRIRAVDELGWFDFTNTVTVMNKLDIARKSDPSTQNQQVSQSQF